MKCEGEMEDPEFAEIERRQNERRKGSPALPCSRSQAPTLPPRVVVAVSLALLELERAIAKHPTWPVDPCHALAVLGEEYGELVREVTTLTYEPEQGDRVRVREEAIQTAAMALRFLAGLESYEYEPSPQTRTTML